MTNRIWIVLTLILIASMLGYGQTKERIHVVPQIGSIFK